MWHFRASPTPLFVSLPHTVNDPVSVYPHTHPRTAPTTHKCHLRNHPTIYARFPFLPVDLCKNVPKRCLIVLISPAASPSFNSSQNSINTRWIRTALPLIKRLIAFLQSCKACNLTELILWKLFKIMTRSKQPFCILQCHLRVQTSILCDYLLCKTLSHLTWFIQRIRVLHYLT